MRNVSMRGLYHGTTILGVRRGDKVAMGGDGQVTLDDLVVKEGARKVRKLYTGKVLVGFAGGVADALTLLDRFEAKLEEFRGNLPRAVVELAKDWRTDKFLRRLEALLAIMDKEHSYIVSGGGEVVEPDDGLIGIGSGGAYALAAARALIRFTDLEPKEIVKESLIIASSICVYTNQNIIVETL